MGSKCSKSVVSNVAMDVAMDVATDISGNVVPDHTCSCGPFCGITCITKMNNVYDPSTTTLNTTITTNIDTNLATMAADAIGITMDAVELLASKSKISLYRKHPYNLKFTKDDEKMGQFKKLKLSKPRVSNLPDKVDLREQFQSPYDQGELGSCTANAICGIVGYLDKNHDFFGSRLFVYYNERQMEGTIADDSGADLADGIKSLAVYGICSEKLWPYDISKFTVKPTDECYKEALENQALEVRQISNDIYSMKNALYQGNPFVVGIMIYDSFETDYVAETGMVPMPDVYKEQCLGGHAVVCCGYDLKNNIWIMRNSWGSDWGDKGYFYLPFAYLTDSSLSSDLWTVIKMEKADF